MANNTSVPQVSPTSAGLTGMSNYTNPKFVDESAHLESIYKRGQEISSNLTKFAANEAKLDKENREKIEGQNKVFDTKKRQLDEADEAMALEQKTKLNLDEKMYQSYRNMLKSDNTALSASEAFDSSDITTSSRQAIQDAKKGQMSMLRGAVNLKEVREKMTDKYQFANGGQGLLDVQNPKLKEYKKVIDIMDGHFTNVTDGDFAYDPKTGKTSFKYTEDGESKEFDLTSMDMDRLNTVPEIDNAVAPLLTDKKGALLPQMYTTDKSTGKLSLDNKKVTTAIAGAEVQMSQMMLSDENFGLGFSMGDMTKTIGPMSGDPAGEGQEASYKQKLSEYNQKITEARDSGEYGSLAEFLEEDPDAKNMFHELNTEYLNEKFKVPQEARLSHLNNAKRAKEIEARRLADRNKKKGKTFLPTKSIVSQKLFGQLDAGGSLQGATIDMSQFDAIPGIPKNSVVKLSITPEGEYKVLVAQKGTMQNVDGDPVPEGDGNLTDNRANDLNYVAVANNHPFKTLQGFLKATDTSAIEFLDAQGTLEDGKMSQSPAYKALFNTEAIKEDSKLVNLKNLYDEVASKFPEGAEMSNQDKHVKLMMLEEIQSGEASKYKVGVKFQKEIKVAAYKQMASGSLDNTTFDRYLKTFSKDEQKALKLKRKTTMKNIITGVY